MNRNMTNLSYSKLSVRVGEKISDWKDNKELAHKAAKITAALPEPVDQRPVIFFKASSGILRMSLNSAFGLLTAWSLQTKGIPVIHFDCQEGMSRCVLGTNREDPYRLPPCSACMRHSRARLTGEAVQGFKFNNQTELSDLLKGLSLLELERFELEDYSLGQIVLPSLRWILRRHYLEDNESTRFLMREYIVSAHHLIQEFTLLLEKSNPQAVVVYNGMFFPEAIAKQVAESRGIRVISHEVALRPVTAFFTTGEATAYPIQIPDGFKLSASQNEKLDATLQERFKGNFTMAGIRFWPEMKGLEDAFLEKAAEFRQIVPIFTNVIFDTSQVHANTIFRDMFIWLDEVLKIIQKHPETLFVIRAHPDEMRPNKRSEDNVQGWVKKNKVDNLNNVVFVESSEYLSSYDLIQRSKFVMVYNSSIGMEAALLGAAVLCAGKGRYTQYPMVYLPTSASEYHSLADDFLSQEKITVPEEFRIQARRFLYYQLFKTSLPFGDYLDDHQRPGFVKLKNFDIDQLDPERSEVMRVIHEGIIKGGNFILTEVEEHGTDEAAN